jgi:membrane-bound lytic murein transglycosylase D
LLDEGDARVLEVGSEEFFAHFEGLKGRKRIEIAVREGDSFSKIAGRYGLSVGSLERINQRSRRSLLMPGDRLVVYVPTSRPDEPAPVEPREDEVRVASTSAAGAVDDGDKAAADEPVKPAVLLTPAAPVEAAKAAPVEVAKADAGAGEGKPRGARTAGAGDPGGAAPEEKKAAEGEKRPAAGGADDKKPALRGAAEKQPAGRAKEAQGTEKPASGNGTAL